VWRRIRGDMSSALLTRISDHWSEQRTYGAVRLAGRALNHDAVLFRIYGGGLSMVHKSRLFLEAISPYVKLKVEQIEVYLQILDVLPRGRGQRRETGARATIEAGAMKLRALKRGA
jgi:hypothetical protein